MAEARTQSWTLAVWDIAGGLRMPFNPTEAKADISDPLAALRMLPTFSRANLEMGQDAAGPADGTTLLLLPNFHRFLNSAEIVQTLYRELLAGKQRRTFIVILSPIVQIPAELERSFIVLEHELPAPAELREIAKNLLADSSQSQEHITVDDPIVEAASGLTRAEAEGAFALSLSRHDELRPEAIWELKAQTLRKQNLLSLHRSEQGFSSLGGLEVLKDFCRSALRPGASVRARGTLLLSPPGCGKSAFCKALGHETGRPVLSLDIGALLGGLVGEDRAECSAGTENC